MIKQKEKKSNEKSGQKKIQIIRRKGEEGLRDGFRRCKILWDGITWIVPDHGWGFNRITHAAWDKRNRPLCPRRWSMRIITVSRQFGSGGRELGKRLAEALDWDYYDREIITALAEQQGMDPEEVRRALSTHGWHHYPVTCRNSFRQALGHSWNGMPLLVRQREIIQEIAEAGNDCVIVGRDADVILHEYHPFRMLICADLDARLERCMEHERKKPAEEQLSEKEILRNIRRIDRNRRQTREVLTGKAVGDGSTFDITVNTKGKDTGKLVEAIMAYHRIWLEA